MVVGDIRTRVIVPKVTTCTVFGAVSHRHNLIALCHIFQHGRNPHAENNLPTQYADNAVEALARMVQQKGTILDYRLGKFFLIGSTDMVTAAYVIHNIFPRLGLPGRGVVADVGSDASERKVMFQRSKLYLEKSTVSGLQLLRLI